MKSLLYSLFLMVFLNYAHALEDLYPNRAQSWNFGCVKAPGFNDKKGGNINSNMDPFFIVEPRELSRGPNSNFVPDWGIDAFLKERGFLYIAEGFTSNAQREIFFNDISSLQDVNKILEIGFNAGHSCECFLNSPSLPKVVSFDINHHPYTRVGVEFMYEKYGDRFEFVEGDSRSKITEYASSHRGEKFDLIFIDGCHSFDCCRADIRNCRRLAHKNTLLWIDDYDVNGNDVQSAVDFCERKGIITILQVKSVPSLRNNSGLRTWAIAKYKKTIKK